MNVQHADNDTRYGADSNTPSVEWERPRNEWWNTRRGLTHQIDYGDWRAGMHSTHPSHTTTTPHAAGRRCRHGKN